MEWWFLAVGAMCAIASGIIAIGYASNSTFEPRFGSCFIFGASALMLMWLIGVCGSYYVFHAWLLDACIEKERIVREREFVCTIPLNAYIKDGQVDHFTLPRRQQNENIE